MTLQVFKAGNGDAILIKFIDKTGVTRNILVDGGNLRSSFNENLAKYLEDNIVNQEKIDLLVISHLDQDHIKGILYLLEAMRTGASKLNALQIEHVWFNSRKSTISEALNCDISSADMLKLEGELQSLGSSVWYKQFVAGDEVNFYGAKITIVSPDIETLNQYIEKYKDVELDISATVPDYSFNMEQLFELEQNYIGSGNEFLDNKLENAVSLAFLLEYSGKSVLMLGDAIPSVIDTSLKKLLDFRGTEALIVDVVKLSHHGSRKSLSANFLNYVWTDKYVISTNGKKSNLPNKATLSKILFNSARGRMSVIEFYFNYSEVIEYLNIPETEFDTLNFRCIPPNQKWGTTISLQ